MLGCTVLAAILTPTPDVYNMTLINDEEIEVLGPVVGMRTGEQRAATR